MRKSMHRILTVAAMLAAAPITAFADTDYAITLTQSDNTRSACHPLGVPVMRLAGKTVTMGTQSQCIAETKADGNFACSLSGANQPTVSFSGKISGSSVDGTLTIIGAVVQGSGAVRTFNCASSFHGVAKGEPPSR